MVDAEVARSRKRGTGARQTQRQTKATRVIPYSTSTELLFPWSLGASPPGLPFHVFSHV